MSRILIIEDETSIAELERDYLELSDFEVELEEDGSKGLERALNEEFDLMILDLMLPGMIEIRGLKIDKTARRVWIHGEEKNFTTKEFDLLVFLAQNPNHVYTKEELFSKIWDMESIGDIATVTVHIKKIREKIEFNTAKPQYIETIWGVGYRFKV